MRRLTLDFLLWGSDVQAERGADANTDPSRNVTLASARPDAVGLVEEELPIAKSRFRVLIDRDLDGLDVRSAPTFSR